ncbi:MAG: hypothetical protein HQL76_02460 [Magnetococcales bacterium]|nr:hypothetical protein [Magnetococcales bacterium]
MFTRYMIEIYEPGDVETVIARFEASEPFNPIHVGEFISPHVWPEPARRLPNSQHLRVVAVEHMMFRLDRITTFKTMYYTEIVKHFHRDIFDDQSPWPFWGNDQSGEQPC